MLPNSAESSRRRDEPDEPDGGEIPSFVAGSCINEFGSPVGVHGAKPE